VIGRFGLDADGGQQPGQGRPRERAETEAVLELAARSEAGAAAHARRVVVRSCDGCELERARSLVELVDRDLLGIEHAAKEGRQGEQRVAAGLAAGHHLPELAHDRRRRAVGRVKQLELVLELGAGDRHAPLAAALGQQEDAVGPLEQLVGGQRLKPLSEAGRARRDLQDRRAHALSHRPGVLLAGTGQQDHELVPAVAGQPVVLAQLGAQRARDAPQELVARLVPALVVDGLELIQVDQQARQRRPVASRPRDLPAGALVQRTVVEQAGERVRGSGGAHLFVGLGVAAGEDRQLGDGLERADVLVADPVVVGKADRQRTLELPVPAHGDAHRGLQRAQ